jgi:membrane protease YdiL (CAAX protease family)
MGMGVGASYLFTHYQYPATLLEGRKAFSQILADPAFIREYLGLLLRQPVYQLFYAGGMEEPLFRGFLWGALRQAGWKDGWICMFQAGLFCLGHIFYLTGGLYWSFGFTFLAGLVWGILAWRSHSIAPSMLAHGFSNAWGGIFQVISW